MRISRSLLIINAVCFLAIVFLYGLAVVDYFRARSAEVAALANIPRLWFDLPVLLLAIAFAGLVVFGAVKGRDADFKGFRLLPILLVVALFVDVFGFSGGSYPVSSADQSSIALHLFARELQTASRGDRVPDDQSEVDALVQKLGAPALLVKGDRLPRFGVQVRTGCEGPILDAPGAAPATFLYCVSKDKKLGWLTLVGLPAEQRFGTAALFTRGGEPQVVTVEPVPPEEAGEALGD